MTTQPTNDLSKYVSEHVRGLITEPVYVLGPMTCSQDGCGARVRYIGNRNPGGAWHCPVCGTSLPYVFWEVRHDPSRRMPALDELVLALADTHCEVCGEGNGPCRCERKALAAKAETVRRLYQSGDFHNGGKEKVEIEYGAFTAPYDQAQEVANLPEAMRGRWVTK